MDDASRLLEAAGQGDRQAAAHLLPLVYAQLRELASQRLSKEKPGITLQPTALVHEAYLRLIGEQRFDGRGHFFAAAAEAMRRILVENARTRATLKRGGGLARVEADLDLPMDEPDPAEILAVHEALDALAERSPRRAELVKLRFFLACTMPEAAQALGVSLATAEEDWAFARAWLRRHWRHDEEKNAPG